MSSFTKFLDNLKTQQKPSFAADSTIRPMAPGTVDDSTILSAVQQQPKRRWSYVTYLNEGTLHGDGDNLMVGL